MERPATPFAAVQKFRFGVPVQTEDGEQGTLVEVFVDVEQRTLTGIGAKFGLTARSRRYIPRHYITHSNAELTNLSLPLEAVQQELTERAQVPALSSGTRVTLNGKRLGSLKQLTIDRETAALRHLVVERGLRSEVLVPALDVASLDGRQIIVSVEGAGSQPLIPYRPDEELHEEIRQAIEDYSRLRVDLPGIGIHVIDGVVWLRGHVASELNKRLVEDQITGIRGIGELHNELIPDNLLAADISRALSRDSRTSGEKIGVYPMLGVVRLRGSVRTAAARAAAGEIARAVPGARAVENELHVNPDATTLPVLAGVTNAEDIVPGGE